ncbi:MAG: hypothetical protein IVW55_08770 [Chloroflexi bacterium]|nr:hypothetical protein [Chloroflexota bacterium]
MNTYVLSPAVGRSDGTKEKATPTRGEWLWDGLPTTGYQQIKELTPVAAR